MLFRSLAILFFLSFLFTNCDSKIKQPAKSAPVDITIDTLYQFMDFDSHGISRPGSITILPNRNIAVADGQIKKITIVDTEGQMVSQFGKEGRGPSEFLFPGHLTFASGFLNVVDQNQYKVLEFDLDGNFMNSFSYESNAVGSGIALSDNREYYTGAAGENNKLIKWAKTDTDTSFLFGEAKISRVEDMDMEASRNDIINGRVPDYFKNNVNVIIGDDHLYAFLDSYSELRKYDASGKLIWAKKLGLPDNEKLENDIAEAAKRVPNALPFLRYTLDVKVIDSDIYLLGSKPREAPQHLTKVNKNGKIIAFYQMPFKDSYFVNFTINPTNNTIYLSDLTGGIVYKGSLQE